MKILVTGSAGFIGRHLVEELELDDHERALSERGVYSCLIADRATMHMNTMYTWEWEWEMGNLQSPGNGKFVVFVR